MQRHLTRRTLLQLAAAGSAARVLPAAPAAVSLFDGKTLDGWIQIENSATTIATGNLTDPAALARKLTAAADPLSAYLRGHLQESTKPGLDAQALTAALRKDLNPLLDGPSLYDPARFAGVTLRPETARLLRENPQGVQLAHLNKLLLEDAYPAELAKSASTGWVVKDGAMASTGVGRGVIYTAKDYGRFRLRFTMRHVSGDPDHQACVLIFCTRPQPGERPLDALAGIQFQVPNGGRWDYRRGKNNNGGDEFTLVSKTKLDPRQWSRVEIVADASKGVARMAVEGVEVLQFKDPTAGKSGPIAWQMHNPGLFDEYKDVSIEVEE